MHILCTDLLDSFLFFAFCEFRKNHEPKHLLFDECFLLLSDRFGALAYFVRSSRALAIMVRYLAAPI